MDMEGVHRIDEVRLEVPMKYKEGMRTRGLIYLDETLEGSLERKAVEQVANVASLPGIVGPSLAMPDVHMGYGFTIGGVAAFDLKTGVVSPGGVGYDINCGVRLIRSSLTKQEVAPRLRDLVGVLYNEIPSGVGSKGRISLSPQDERRVMMRGARWAVEQGMGSESDLEHTESGGCMEGADAGIISPKAYERGRSQLGTLGAGNHFLEIQYVDEIYDTAVANAMGLFEGQVTVMIHTGSRGFGHQVCTDYLEIMERAARKYNIVLPDRELACAPIISPEAQDYLAAMRGAANYAWANRQCIMHWSKEAFMRVMNLSPARLGMSLVYDVAHNIAKIEEHMVDGRRRRLLVHRKGSTRAFPPGHMELPPAYRALGQPVLLPGDMGRASYVLLGTEEAMRQSWGSTCHGAGRLLSRHHAVRQARGRAIWRELEDSGIVVMSRGRHTLAEEMPEAYKDIGEVVDVVQRVGISRKVARLRPMGVIKG